MKISYIYNGKVVSSDTTEISASVVIARLVRRLRHEAGMDHQQMAEYTGIPRSTLQYLERGEGNPTVELIDRLFSSLDIDIRLLLPAWKEASLFAPSTDSSRSEQEAIHPS
ncbi:MAG: helix-turn-helix transcriptional regulator [Bacteroidaceae bacterium]|nr:helix-turn-helix transcriptional regulator [Bacteroidaceae bacterium]